jgi:hypothetical protein
MTRPQLVPWFKIFSALTVLFILLQAFMAGRFLFTGSDLLREHEIMANAVFLSAIIQLGLLFGLGLPQPHRTRLLVINGLLLLFVVVQIGLGYSDSGDATAWHVANGTFLMGLSGFNLAMALQIPRSAAASPTPS